ncbi:glycosyltransferase [Gleimia sp. 6138-11-ORH1]|uniref:glycosyltransferase n=1 Tax=Gleimia sp. 6138-11-ORH1 TaxID=2973937 RepID=UPI002169A37D|nr:glycosyltransferase [Gleimia sp. 6138-11-ORH1]MCS4484050.1 glycosyltransferase [Gleimia sp. 6138-11-ORH1]
MTEPTVAALVVTRGLTPYLHRTVAALLSQSRKPDTIVVVNTSTTALKPIKGLEILNAPQLTNFNAAVSKALETYPVLDSCDWFWFLHDDSAPDQQCLEQLLTATKAGLTTAVVGPKQVAWSSADRILEVGIETTRSARRLSVESYDEIDQGQYDNISDVLAVGSAGMLVDAQIWRESGGFDPQLTPFGEGLEFCRRIRLGGHRVVVVPEAKIAHARVSYRGLRTGTEVDLDRSFKERRFAQLYNGLILRNLPFLIASLVLLPLWTLLRAGARLLQKRPQLAFAEIAAVWKLYASLPALRNARQRNRNFAKVPVSVLKTLETSHFQINRRQRIENRKEREYFSKTQLEPIAANLLKRHQIRTYSGFGIGFALTFLVTWFATRELTDGISGAAWVNLPESYGTLFWQAWSGWSLGGLGYPPPVDSLLPVLTVLTAPLALLGVSPATQFEWFYRLVPALAWISMYWGTRVITHRVAWRFALALLWVISPVFLLSWSSGRMGTLLVAAFLPLFLRGWMHSVGQVVPLRIRGAFAEEIVLAESEKDYPYTALASFAALVLVGAAPWLLLLLLPFLVVTTIFMRGRRAGQVLLAIPAFAFSLPVWIHVFSGTGSARWQLLFADTGRSLAHSQPSSWEIALGLPQAKESFGNPAFPWVPEFINSAATFIWFIPGAVLLLGAVIALFNLQRWTFRTRLAFLAGIFAVGAAIVASRIVNSEGGALIFGWAGTGILVALIAWMLAATGAIPNLVLVEPLHSYLSRRRREKAVKRREAAEQKQKQTEVSFIDAKVSLEKLSEAEVSATATIKAVTREVDLNATTRGERSAFRFQIGVLALVYAVALVPFVVWLPYESENDLQVAAAPQYLTPATTVEAQQGERSARFMKLSVSDEVVHVEIWRGDGRQLADSSPWQRLENARLVMEKRSDNRFNVTENGSAANADLAQLVTKLLTTPDTVELSQLGQLGVDEIALENSSSLARERALMSLDRVAGLTRAGESGAGTLWRVRPQEVEPARAFIKDAQGRITPIADPTLAAVALPAPADENTILVLAEPKDAGWVASFNGNTIEATENGWQQAFKLPKEAGQVRITWYADWLPVWWFSAVTALIGLLVGAIPVAGRRQSNVY